MDAVIECLVNGPIQTNTYVVISAGEALVIDPAWDGEKLVERVKAMHPDVQIKAIACTHGHADHLGGVAGMRRALGASLAYILPEADQPYVATNIREQTERWGIRTEDPGEPTRLVKEGDAIGVGEVSLSVIAVPGHTPGGVVYLLDDPEEPVAFVGDTLFPGSHGRTDLTGGSETQILASLAKLGRVLAPATVCRAGHGPSTTVARELATNPFM